MPNRSTLLLAAFALLSPVALAQQPAPKPIRVAANGTGDFTTVQAAVNSLPTTGGVIRVMPGTYRERVWIKQSHVTLTGAGVDPAKTRIVFDLSAGAMRDAHSPIPGMATVTVAGDDFHAQNITFENDFNRLHAQVSQGSQAQALNLGGDRNVLHNVRILANQDTLYIGAKGCGQSSGPNCTTTRSYFSHCVVAGNVDFIYGDGIAYFEGCEIQSTEHPAGGYLTAQGKHYANQQSLFVFDHCRLTSVPGEQRVFLGRPWRPFASVVFLHTTFGPHMDPGGWREWHPGDTNYLDTVLYAEFDSHNPNGKPVDLSQRPPQIKRLTAKEAEQYSAAKVLNGTDDWKPWLTRIP